MECCVCYNKNTLLLTKCNHNICIHCLLKLYKKECPMCRKKFDNLPIKINKIIEDNDKKIFKDGLSLFISLLDDRYFLF